MDQLARCGTAELVRDGLVHYDQRAAWRLHAVVIMPDHVHVLVTVSATTDLRHLVINWKRYLARCCGIRWQQDFFEHRLRASEHFDAKLECLRQNPVRAALVRAPEEWPYFYVW